MNFVVTILLSLNLIADIIMSGADGLVGIIAPKTSIEIDLRQATKFIWNAPSLNAGVHDEEKWADVFKHRNLRNLKNIKVTFNKRAGNLPFEWLVSGKLNDNREINQDGHLREPWARNLPQAGTGVSNGWKENYCNLKVNTSRGLDPSQAAPTNLNGAGGVSIRNVNWEGPVDDNAIPKGVGIFANCQMLCKADIQLKKINSITTDQSVISVKNQN